MQGNVLGSSARFFDITNEAQIIALLKEVRHSALDGETKDDIRDVVFDYQSSPDIALLSELQLYLQPLGLRVLKEEVSFVGSEKVSENTKASIEVDLIIPKTHSAVKTTGRTRPVPQWSAAKAVSAVEIVEPVEAVEPEITPVIAVETVIEEAPKVVEELIEAPTEVVTKIEPEVELPAEERVEAAEVTHQTTEEAQARISEIKHIVNEAVGNPVNLIDADNTIGRSYMSALLEAMKAVANGGATLSTAMDKLEIAFAAVQGILPQVVAANSKSEEVSSPTSTEKENNWSTKEEEVEVPEEFVRKVEAAPLSEEVKIEEQMVPQTASTSIPRSSVAAMATSLRQQQVASRPVEVKPEGPTDPLMSANVTAGLEQLLNEWKLFKSSGLFGTGPSGINHPMYANLRNLAMNLVVTGRFEGATPESRQSITDYMNGWRYEQGMTHDMQETFEHYLRRVIKSIIDKRASTVA